VYIVLSGKRKYTPIWYLKAGNAPYKAPHARPLISCVFAANELTTIKTNWHGRVKPIAYV